jgi:hypothetical protein
MPANNQVDPSGAVCDAEDEELTEEEYDLDGEQDDEQDDNDPSTDASSAYSIQDSDLEDDTAIATSPEVQELVQQMPELSDNYHILGKIGEGTCNVPTPAYRARDLQLRLQSGRPQLPALCKCLGSELESSTKMVVATNKIEKGIRTKTSSQICRPQTNIRYEQSRPYFKRISAPTSPEVQPLKSHANRIEDVTKSFP